MKDYVRDLNYLYKNEKSLYELDNTYKGFDFIDPNNKDQSIVTLMRLSKDPKDFIIAVLNFTPNVYYDYKVGVPYQGVYEEILNSDDSKYYGSNQTMENAELFSQDENWHNKPYHIRIKVPPLGATFIKLKREYEEVKVVEDEKIEAVKEQKIIEKEEKKAADKNIIKSKSKKSKKTTKRGKKSTRNKKHRQS